MFLQISVALVIENPVEPRVKGFASIIGTEVSVNPDKRFLDHVGSACRTSGYCGSRSNRPIRV
ncbi:hypothetical protein P0100_20870 [Yersinia pestis]|nr:hypothetical protein [Yersinia pestis]